MTSIVVVLVGTAVERMLGGAPEELAELTPREPEGAR